MTFREAEEYLLGLELFGMRFGLDRMHRLMTVLGLPQRRFASIHVVGSNGKSSTVRFTRRSSSATACAPAATPHPTCARSASGSRWGRSRCRRRDFAAAVERAAHAAELVNRTAGPDDRVTQFEALTAAAYHELARRGVEVAVIEAGLGGRYDATNVIPSKVQVLTAVEPRAHALARADASPTSQRRSSPSSATTATLVTGELDPDVARGGRARARRAARPPGHGPGAQPGDVPLRAAGGFQRRQLRARRGGRRGVPRPPARARRRRGSRRGDASCPAGSRSSRNAR